MHLLVQKFSLLRNGRKYGRGNILDLPEAEALRLAASAPEEFAIVEDRAAAPAAGKGRAEEPAEEEDRLSAMTMTELRKYAASFGISVERTDKNADLIGKIREAEDAPEGLPDIDPEATVR